MRPLARAEALDGGDVLALGGPERRIAGLGRFAVHQHRASAAVPGAAAEARALQPEIIAQDVEKRRLRVRRDLVLAAIDAQLHALFLQCGVYLGHHLLGHQLHGAPGELGVDPIVAGIVERAERADLLAEGEDLLDHAVHAAGDDQLRGHAVGVDRGVGLALVELEEVRAPAEADQLADQLLEVEMVGAFGAVPVALRGLVVIGYENRLRYPPIRGIGFFVYCNTTFLVARPVTRDPLRQQEVRRYRRPAALRGLGHALRMRGHRGDDDRRVRLLVGLDDRALTDFWDFRILGGDVEKLAGK